MMQEFSYLIARCLISPSYAFLHCSVYAAEERLSEVRQQLQGAVAERQQLKERVSTLTAQLDNANANRVREFSSMAQSVARAVEKEFGKGSQLSLSPFIPSTFPSFCKPLIDTIGRSMSFICPYFSVFFLPRYCLSTFIFNLYFDFYPFPACQYMQRACESICTSSHLMTVVQRQDK
jgi:hypothetical protein